MKRSHILFGTQTGTSEMLALELQEELGLIGIEAYCENIFDTTISILEEAQQLFIVISTWGAGDPPDDAKNFFKALQKAHDNSVRNLEFGVVALGDSRYEFFCKCGQEFDRHLERIGGTRIIERVDCDVDYEGSFETWKKELLTKLSPQLATI